MKKNGFTLVELLAVIVILAIILVIAVPKITSTIENARIGSLQSSVKMVAAQAETQKTVSDTLGDDKFTDSGSCIGAGAEWAGLNSSDYSTCEYTITNGVATVTIAGKGKFEGYSCKGTRSKIDTENCKKMQ